MNNNYQQFCREFTMNNNDGRKNEGLFSQSLRSLEIQLKTLFYGSGNDNAIAFLDSLSNLGIVEQEIALNLFKAVVDKIVSGDKRLLSEKDLQQKKIEDDLYNEIITGMNAAASIPNLEGKRLEVLKGGKKSQSNKVLINLDQVRNSKKIALKPELN